LSTQLLPRNIKVGYNKLEKDISKSKYTHLHTIP
jgi:hypothetical protein